VPAYPIEPDKLLDAADRRAVSTAYYAVFHAVTDRVAATVFPSADMAFQQHIRRWIGHADIRTVARWISQLQGTAAGSPPPHMHSLLAPAGGLAHVDADTVTIADGFLELNDKREQADYAHEAVFTRADTRGHIALARQVVAVAGEAQSDAVNRFFGLIAMQAKIQAR